VRNFVIWLFPWVGVRQAPVFVGKHFLIGECAFCYPRVRNEDVFVQNKETSFVSSRNARALIPSSSLSLILLRHTSFSFVSYLPRT